MRWSLAIPLILATLLSFTQLHAADASNKIKPVVILSGSDSAITKPMSERCLTENELQEVWKKHEDGDRKHPCPKVDFDLFMVIALFDGTDEIDTSPSLFEVFEDAESIHLRIHSRIRFKMYSRQTPTLAESPEQIEADRLERITRCYAFIVLPASKKPIVIEAEFRSDSDDLPEWKKHKKLPAIDKKIALTHSASLTH